MLKIVANQESEVTTLRLEGKVVGPWVSSLRVSCTDLLTRGCKVALDLSAVSFVDGEGVALIQELRTRQVTVVRCSPFIGEQLGVSCPPALG